MTYCSSGIKSPESLCYSIFTVYTREVEKNSGAGGYGMKSMWVMFKTNMLTYQSKANLDEKILFGKFTHL